MSYALLRILRANAKATGDQYGGVENARYSVKRRHEMILPNADEYNSNTRMCQKLGRQ